MPLRFALMMVAFVLGSTAQAQQIPAARATDWTVAGYPGDVPSPATVVDAAAFGAVGDGVTPTQAALTAAIQSLAGAPGVVALPPGSYRLTAGVSLPSGVVLRGAGSTNTWLRCDLPSSGSTCVSIAGSVTGGWRDLTAGLAAGSQAVTVADATGFAAGDWADVREANGAWDTKPADWAKNVVGQIVRITAVEGTVLRLEHPLRTTFDPALLPQIVKVVAKTDVGIEDLGIERVADPTPTAAGSNVQFSYAARCWMKGVESNKSVASHVGVYTSTQLEITGCYFHDGFTYDGTGTRGYGVTLNSHSGECLIEGNIFSHLRHAMMVKTGANGNVFAYNFSRDPTRSEAINDFAGDISLHGHWPWLNLFEGNVVANIIIDQYWGPSGPFNTFFRNRAELYGLIVSYDAPSNDQNFVGNEVMAGKSNLLLFVYGLPYALKGTGHLAWANTVKGTGVQPPGTDTLAEFSYYRTPGSDACQLAGDWPSIGVPNALGAGTIRARQRWDAGGVLTVRELQVDAGPGAEVTVGASTVLHGRVSGGYAPVTMAWSPADGLDDPQALEPVATPLTSTTYRLTATDGYGCVLERAAHVRVTGDVEAPVFDPPPGTYTAPQQVHVTVATPGATARCTLDGAEPTQSSPICDQPLPLDETATLRARAFRPDWTPSPETTGTYVFEDIDECAVGTAECAEQAVCSNTWLAYTCACPAGYDGDGFTCAPVCGDGLVVDEEDCDDGPATGAWGTCCTADCHVEEVGTPCAGPDPCVAYACDAGVCVGVGVAPACVCVSHAATACVDGDAHWVTSCADVEEVLEVCGERGCLDGVCCPEGTVETDGACGPPVVEAIADAPTEPPPESATEEAPEAFAEEHPEAAPEPAEPVVEASPEAPQPELVAEFGDAPTPEAAPEPRPEATLGEVVDAPPEAVADECREIVNPDPGRPDVSSDVPTPDDPATADAIADGTPTTDGGGGSSCQVTARATPRSPLMSLLVLLAVLGVRRRWRGDRG